MNITYLYNVLKSTCDANNASVGNIWSDKTNTDEKRAWNGCDKLPTYKNYEITKIHELKVKY